MGMADVARWATLEWSRVIVLRPGAMDETSADRTTPGPVLSTTGDHDMKWETPTAVDVRFGFEITMYISNR